MTQSALCMLVVAACVLSLNNLQALAAASESESSSAQNARSTKPSTPAIRSELLDQWVRARRERLRYSGLLMFLQSRHYPGYRQLETEVFDALNAQQPVPASTRQKIFVALQSYIHQPAPIHHPLSSSHEQIEDFLRGESDTLYGWDPIARFRSR